MIFEVLENGKQKAMSTEELVRYFNFSNRRELQIQIAKERKAGAIILSTAANGGGYFTSNNKQEIFEFCKTLEKRAKNTFFALRSAKKKLEELDAQEDINNIIK